MAVIEVGSKAELDALVADGPVVIDLWATWCAPCRQYGPIFEKTSEAFDGRATFAKVDVDAAADIAAAHNVISVPTTIIFANGEAVETISGPMREKVLTGKVEAHI